MTKKTSPFERAAAIEKEDIPKIEEEFQNAREALNEVLETGHLKSIEEFGVDSVDPVNDAVEEKIIILNDEFSDAASGPHIDKEEIRRISKKLEILEEQQEALAFQENINNAQTLYDLFNLIGKQEMLPNKDLKLSFSVKDVKDFIETAFKAKQNPELFDPLDMMNIIPEDFGLRAKVKELLEKEK